MGKIIVSENVSLDGVVQDPDGKEGFKHGGWFGESAGGDLEEWAKVNFAEAQGAEALLLGRRSDEYFGTRWNVRTGPWAERLNAMAKYVMSSTADEACWNNGTVLKGDAVTEAARLKQEIDGDVVVYASLQLVRALMQHDLVDELRLTVFPVVIGSGERLFDDTTDKTFMRLIDNQTVGESLTCLSYELIDPR